MRERLINRRQQGDLGEVSAIEWLTRQGATVFVPLGHSPDVDLLADVVGHLYRVQVKTSTRQPTPNGAERWEVRLATNGGNQSWTGKIKTLDPERLDYLYVLVGDGRRWFIPAGAVEAQTSMILGGSRYAEFEISPGPPIDPLVYGPRIASPARGSAGAGEPGQTVNLVAMPEWVRIPPPPSRPELGPRARGRALRYQRTRISTSHQVTVPSVPFCDAGLNVGDRLQATADGPGRVILERIET